MSITTHPMFQAVASSLSYCIASASMIYSNKYILSVFGFQQAGVLLICQNIVSVVSLMAMAQFLPFVSIPALRANVALKWLPVAVMFALMLFTGSKTIAYLTIPILTVFKNLTNIAIAFGDWYMFDQVVSGGVLLSFGMMLAGSILSGITDLNYSLLGYLWMCGNVAAQTGYVLSMKKVQKDTRLNEWASSYYLNLLSIAVFAVVCILNGEFLAAWHFPGIFEPLFISCVFFSGLVGTILSVCVFWTVSATSPTTYSMIGALNKIPITLVSFLFFAVPISTESALSLAFALLSGVVYTHAKYIEQRNEQLLPVVKP